MSLERGFLVALAVVTATSIATALLRADGTTWPAALLGGCAAGGFTLWGLLGLFVRRKE
ncbi:hypothetical protein [Nonomuraea helvata]|uniref:Uncharacterized protein n=1 Tax=Nonomuraea helvata TaxID=37484 RepID=A0ABV5SI36_9ACTN